MATTRRDNPSPPPSLSAVRADIKVWVSRLDKAVDELYLQLERIPTLVGEEDHGADRRPQDVRRHPER